MAGDESPLRKRKFEGLSILKDIVHTENKGASSRTRSHSKSKLVAKDPKIGTISCPIDSNNIIEMESIDCNGIIELDFDNEEEANTNVTADPGPQQELKRKRKSFSDAHTRGLVDCIAEASELAKKAMAELDERGKELQATRAEVACLHFKEQVRAARDQHRADRVAQLKEALSVANAQHAAEVCRLADEHRRARAAHGEEVKAQCASEVAKLQEEHAAAVAQLTEHLKAEHAAAVARLREEHADGVARLKKRHAAEVGRLADDRRKLQGEHAAAVARLKEEHAADVARVNDAADKEVQDAKKNIVLRLFPKLDASLLSDQGSSSGEISAAAGTPNAQGRS